MPITDKLNSIITKLSDGTTKPTGQTIEEKLDIIDSLIDAGGSGGGGALMVELSSHEELDGIVSTANKTAGEILDAIKAGKNIIWHGSDDENCVNKYGYEVGTSTNIDANKEITLISFYICWQDELSFNSYTATSLDDYPSCTYDAVPNPTPGF